MQDTKGCGMPVQSGDRGEKYRAVVAELASVIEHVRKSVRLIESALASEAAAEESAADDVIVLDDVTPGYARMNIALRECDARLSVVFCLVQGPDTAAKSAGEGGLPPARWPVSA
mgnify:CR=1 FL=1